MSDKTMIYHITTPEDWNGQADSEVYTHISLKEEGFIHCSKAEQIEAVIERYFREVRELLLLQIDPQLLENELKYELSTGNEWYPHIYGSINKGAIVEVKNI
ncbi:MAG: DUF952 domain-containing protein [Chitinophagales bacterium]